MPNLYATVAEVKASGAQPTRQTQDDYDSVLTRLIGNVSRWFDGYCKRVFFPTVAVRYFSGPGSTGSPCALRVPDLVSITEVAISYDDGQTYTALTTNDYYATVAGDYNSPQSYDLLAINRNSATLSYWPRGQRSIRITGTWGFCDDRDAAFVSTGDTVENNPLAADGTSLTVNDVDGLDIYGLLPRFSAGQVLKIGSELIETALPISTVGNTIGLVRGVNGSTAAAHNQNVAISVWRPPAPVQEAAAIQVVRQLMRGLQGFGEGTTRL